MMVYGSDEARTALATRQKNKLWPAAWSFVTQSAQRHRKGRTLLVIAAARPLIFHFSLIQTPGIFTTKLYLNIR